METPGAPMVQTIQRLVAPMVLGKAPDTTHWHPPEEEVKLHKVSLDDQLSQMGRSTRNAITGKVKLKGVDCFQDFSIVDLFTRDSIQKTPDELHEDPYLFRPVLLGYRTWLYHFDYTARITSFERGEHSMLRQALEHVCVDAPVSAGRWSPLMSFVPLCLCMSLTGDILLITVPLIMLGILHVVTNVCNNAKWYKLLRPVTFVPRFAFFFFLLIRLLLDLFQLHSVAIVGFILSLMISLVDLVVGDGSILFAMRLQCNYEILQALPSRIFVCRRIGAFQLESLFGNRGAVPEVVSGFSPWEADHTLIADIHGIIVELRPVEKEEWHRLATLETTIHFLALDIYDEDNLSTADFLKKNATMAMANSLSDMY